MWSKVRFIFRVKAYLSLSGWVLLFWGKLVALGNFFRWCSPFPIWIRGTGNQLFNGGKFSASGLRHAGWPDSAETAHAHSPRLGPLTLTILFIFSVWSYVWVFFLQISKNCHLPAYHECECCVIKLVKSKPVPGWHQRPPLWRSAAVAPAECRAARCRLGLGKR